MISIKKIISTTAIAVLSVSLFAQFAPSSKTSEATQGLFDTDVDKFMILSLWDEINAE